MSTFRGKELIGHAWAYPVYRGQSPHYHQDACEASGDEIVTTQHNVMVPVCDGHKVLGDRLIAVRFSSDEKRRYSKAEREAFVRAHQQEYISQALDY